MNVLVIFSLIFLCILNVSAVTDGANKSDNPLSIESLLSSEERVKRAEIPVSPGCTLLMYLNNDTKDYSGNGNDGTITGGVEWKSTVGNENMLYFNGTDGYIDLKGKSTLVFGLGDFSIECWIKSQSVDSLPYEWNHTMVGLGALEHRWVKLAVCGARDSSHTGKLIFFVFGEWAVYSTNTYDDNKWHHIVATADRDGLAKLYVDGKLESSADMSGYKSSSYGNDSYQYIGRDVNGNYFGGALDEVCIYKRVLTAEEVAEHFNPKSLVSKTEERKPISLFENLDIKEVSFEPPIKSYSLILDMLISFREHLVWKNWAGWDMELRKKVYLVGSWRPLLAEQKIEIQLGYNLMHSAYPEESGKSITKVSEAIQIDMENIKSEVTPISKYRIDEKFFKSNVNLNLIGQYRKNQSYLFLTELTDVWLGGAGKWLGDEKTILDEHFLISNIFLIVRDINTNKVRTVPLYLFQPLKILDFQPSTEKVGNVFLDNEECLVKLNTVNFSDKPQKSTINYDVTDYASKDKVFNGSAEIEIAPISIKELTLKLNLKRKGIFNVEFTLGSETNSKKSLRLCIIPTPDNDISYKDSQVGINIFQQQFWWYTYDLPLMTKAGVKWIRPWLVWENCWSHQEPEPGKYNWTHMDNAIMRTEKFGLGYTYMFYRAPKWAYGNSWWGNNIDGNKKWIDYAKVVVDRYKDRIKIWEVWNEPNGSEGGKAEDYATFLKSLYPVIKSVCPDSTVVGVSLACTYFSYLEQFCKAGGLEYCDAVSVHPALLPTASPEISRFGETILPQFNDIINRYGGENKKIIVNEIAQYAYDYDPKFVSRGLGVTEINQARWLVRDYQIGLSKNYVGYIQWFCTLDPRDSVNASTGDSGCGILYMGYIPKLAYPAFANMTKQIGTAKILGRLKLENKEIYAYAWKKNQEVIITIWSTPQEHQIDLDIGTDTIKIVDMFGNEEVVKTKNDILRIDTSENPKYLVGANYEKIFSYIYPFETECVNKIELEPNKPQKIIFYFNNIVKTSKEKISWKDTKGITVTPSQVEIDLRDGKENKVVFTAISQESVRRNIIYNLKSENEIEVTFEEPKPVFFDDFESGTEKYPEGWVCEGNDNYVWDDTTAKSGKKSLCIKKAAGEWESFKSKTITVNPNTYYIFSFYGKYSGTGTMGARGVVKDVTNNRYIDMTAIATNSKEWTYLSSFFATSPNTTEILIDMHSCGPDKDGDVWFDDVEISE